MRAARGFAVALIAVAVLVAAPLPARADVDDFTFESLDVDYTLERDDSGASVVRVVERFVALFPEIDQNRGMQRILPDSYQGAPLDPELISITDGDGAPRATEVSQEDGAVTFTSRADDYVHGRQTYVFEYTMRNVTRNFADTGADEFYWDVNGVDWSQPFGRVTARVHLDADLAAALTGQQACYAGNQGAETPCAGITVAEDGGGTVITAEAADVAPFQTLTIAVGFDTGTFTAFDPRFFASVWGWLQTVTMVLLGGAIAWAVAVRSRVLRDAPGRPTIIAEYTPPPSVDALEAAVLLGKSAKAIPAEVLEQAVVGSIRIVEGGRRWFGGAKLEAHLVDPSRADGDGRMLLEGLFGRNLNPGEVFEFGRQDTRFSTAARKILAAAGKELGRRGLQRAVPVSQRVWPFVAAIVCAGLAFAFGVAALTSFVSPAVPLVLLIVAIGAVFIVGAVIAHKPLTALGAETRDHLAGLKIFIEWAEADRIRMLQSPAGAERRPIDTNDPRQMLHIYEALLPYAVVFGQEKDWAERLAVLYDTTGSPNWYYGTSGFSASAFAAGVSSLSTTASSSSSTGGSSGGGSAGGGGGGGGGGGV